MADIRTPVRRVGAQNYLLISLVSFAGSVMVTRLFLSLTGYPQIGRGELHIAHVLWGGLLLFIASLLPLIFANRWVYILTSALSGIGIGLFIDEVGKFITRTNDYFYPPAAPIIYAFFLLTVVVYLRIRRPASRDPRNEFYHVLDDLTEVIDRDLEPEEKTDIQTRLQHIIDNTSDPNLTQLAQSLMVFIAGDRINLVPPRLTFIAKIRKHLQGISLRYITQRRFRFTLGILLTVIGVSAWYDLFIMLPTAGSPHMLENLLAIGILRGQVRSAPGAIWFLIHLIAQSMVGILAIISGGLLITGKEKRGVAMATVCLIISLTVVDLLSFYVNQFSAAITAMGQLCVLIALILYNRRFFKDE
jgi:hypothetical protein